MCPGHIAIKLKSQESTEILKFIFITCKLYSLLEAKQRSRSKESGKLQ
jgi:hypothetical protein